MRLHTMWRSWLNTSLANQITFFALSLTLAVSSAVGTLVLLPLVGWLVHRSSRRLVASLGRLSRTFKAIAISGVITVPLEARSPNEVGRLAAVQAKLNRFKKTLDQALEAIFIFDPESLRFAHVNEGAKRQTGHSQSELMQMTPMDAAQDATADVI